MGVTGSLRQHKSVPSFLMHIQALKLPKVYILINYVMSELPFIKMSNRNRDIKTIRQRALSKTNLNLYIGIHT